MNANMTEFFTLLDAAGQLPSKIDAALAAARAGNPPVDQNPHVREAHDTTAKLGLTLAALEAWGKKQDGASPEEPQPNPGPGSAGSFPEEWPAAGVLPWVRTEPNVPVCIKLPATTTGSGVSMVIGGASQNPLYVVVAPEPIKDIATIKAMMVYDGKGAFGIGSTPRLAYTPGHYMSCFFEPNGGDDFRPQLLRGDAF